MSNLLGFVIPFKPKAESANWELDLLLLKRTVATILRNNSTNIYVYVICSNLIDLKIPDNRLKILSYPFSVFPITELADFESLLSRHYDSLYLKRHLDKSRKIMWGCKLAKDDKCNYIMNVDSDDLVSKKLINFLLTQDIGLPGWYIPKGYVYHEKARRLFKVPKNMHFLNGSTHIINHNLINVPDNDTKNWNEINFFTDHGYLKERLRINKGIELIPISFFAIIYCRNGISNISEPHVASFSKIKNWAKYIWTYKMISPKIIDDFNLNYESVNLRALLQN